VDSFIAINKERATCDLVLKTSSELAAIRGAVVFGEQIFEEESLFVFPRQPDVQVGPLGGREGGRGGTAWL
jgi:hypothetical protein